MIRVDPTTQNLRQLQQLILEEDKIFDENQVRIFYLTESLDKSWVNIYDPDGPIHKMQSMIPTVPPTSLQICL